MNSLDEMFKLIQSLKSKKEIEKFFSEIFTPDEMSLLEKRWRILNMLSQKRVQRDIAKELNVSLCKITRGSKILKDKNSITYKYFTKEKNYAADNK